MNSNFLFKISPLSSEKRSDPTARKNPYLFKGERFGISEGRLHLLRNEFNYETIPMDSISAIEVRDGKDLKNWWWVLIVGLALIGYALRDLYYIFFLFGLWRIDVERVLIIVLPMALGVYSIFIALRNTRVMIVKSTSKSYYLSLRELVKRQQFIEFVEYMEKSHRAFSNKAR
ncbi:MULTISPECIES: hypothetical protein [Niastella]|uniref:Uncharacterized protein n=1 Tax=Niastella soli TaxID=2821487 RepID=A0ABS3YLI4_9BACT|nr:hypothetical protein [Niastella soli]MBO9198754.1 hypothetical protein [Niastella soli]